MTVTATAEDLQAYQYRLARTRRELEKEQDLGWKICVRLIGRIWFKTSTCPLCRSTRRGILFPKHQKLDTWRHKISSLHPGHLPEIHEKHYITWPWQES